MKRSSICSALIVLSMFCSAEVPYEPKLIHRDLLIIAHRGASGHLPEHTLPAYRLAIDQGADFIEPDLVVTKDRQLVCLHDVSLSRTTDIAEHAQFYDRQRRVNGQLDWFVSDFTLVELRQLRTRQAYGARSSAHDGMYEIPTFQDAIDLVRTHNLGANRPVGIYPELKATDFFSKVDVPRLLLDELASNGLSEAKNMVFIQSFDPNVLRALRSMTELPLVILLRSKSHLQPTTPNIALADVIPFVDVIGASKHLILGPLGEDTGFVAAARQYGVPVHAWTVRDDAVHLAYRSVHSEILALQEVGVAGLFTDFPDTAVRLLEASKP
jgi:glycerophosphoryl diester phosphodiesterase